MSGTLFYVQPFNGRDPGEMDNWPLSGMPWWKQIPVVFSGRYLRWMHPKNEKQLRAAISFGEAWCERHNAAERDGAEALDRALG